jgi:RsiW-degrading membrane proteinase PrsW (M82 family)
VITTEGTVTLNPCGKAVFGILVYIVVALAPSLLLLIWLYTRDSLHPEPKHLVHKLFLLGAAIVLPAGLIERMLLESDFLKHGFWLEGTILTAFFVAGMVEEFLKAAIVERSAVGKGYVKSPIDCIIYSGATALGFATVENVLYVTSSGFSTAILRSVTAVPAHFMFGIIMGTYFARSIFQGQSIAFAYVIPAIAHGIYDSFALSNSWIGDVFLVFYLGFLLEWTLRKLDRARNQQAV